MKTLVFVVAASCSLFTVINPTFAQGSVFTYQGQFTTNGTNFTGLVEFQFTLWNATNGGSQVAATMPDTSLFVNVSNGLFSVPLDFGADAFPGADRWVRIQARTVIGPFTTLMPRQKVTATPYAITAGNVTGPVAAAQLTGAIPVSQVSGTISLAQLPTSVVTNNANNVTLEGSFTGNGTGLTNLSVPAANLMGVLSAGQVPNLDASKITSGTLDVARIPDLNASKIASGTLADSRLSTNVALLDGDQSFDGSNLFSGVLCATNEANKLIGTFHGDGDGLTNLNASSLAGTVDDARLSVNIARLDGSGPFTGLPAFNGGVSGSTPPFMVDSTSLVANLNADLLDGLDASAFASSNHNHDAVYWKLGGNSGTMPGTHFLGTTDNQSLELKVNGQRAFRLEPTGFGMPNVIGGAPNNQVSAGTIGGTIAGGSDNSITNSPGASIGGGEHNLIGPGADSATIGGGRYNRMMVAPGGLQNGAQFSTIGGGSSNTIVASVFPSEFLRSDAGTIAGGHQNSIRESPFGTIAGGNRNSIQPVSEFFDGAGGAAIAGGESNHIYNPYSSIGGGLGNSIQGLSTAGTVSGGRGNIIGDESGYSVIGGGISNIIVGYASTVSGGNHNRMALLNDYCTISGGTHNTIGEVARFCTIGGGVSNTIGSSAAFATIPGGNQNAATGSYSFAAGRRAKANHDGAFVWADSQDADFASTANNQVSFRCSGGVRFDSGSGGANQIVEWVPGGASWSFSSDRRLKEAVKKVDTKGVLEKVVHLPVNEWSYRGYGQRHIGPMAQDFHALFALNDKDTMLDSGDLHGVALAAIQGLNQKLEEKLQQKETEITELRNTVAELKQLVEGFAAQLSGGAK